MTKTIFKGHKNNMHNSKHENKHNRTRNRVHLHTKHYNTNLQHHIKAKLQSYKNIHPRTHTNTIHTQNQTNTYNRTTT